MLPSSYFFTSFKRISVSRNPLTESYHAGEQLSTVFRKTICHFC
nr:MAG TPA: hypothetical protein [Caudoviricetes sp.]